MTKEYVMKRLELLNDHKGVQTFSYEEAKIVLEEIERLHSIIKEVREYINNCSILGENEVDSYCIDVDVKDDILEILEKENI